MSLSVLEKAQRFLANLPHCQRLGLSVVSAQKNQLIMRLPYSKEIIGNPLSGVLHGGALTTLMDTASGTAVFASLPGYELCPTLDLRMDYMKAAEAGVHLLAEAKVIRISKNVVFTECMVYQEQDETLIARCAAAFMRIGAELTPPAFETAIENNSPMEVKL